MVFWKWVKIVVMNFDGGCMKLNIGIIFSLLFTSSVSFGLVDYTPRSKSSSKQSGPKIDISAMMSQNKSSQVRVTRKANPLGMIHFNTGYNSVDMGTEKYDLYTFGGTLITPWNLYFDLDLTYGGSTEEGKSYSLGNTEFSVGARWLEYGRQYNMISLDVIGGMSLGVEDSDIGSERNDSYVGLLTKKNFGHMDLTLGFEHWFMDDSPTDNEALIGGLNKYLVNMGYTASSDIRFDLGVHFINISDIEGTDDISYTEVSPQIGLKLSRMMTMTLGANFSSGKELDVDSLKNLKLWTTESLYGNSYFAKMSLSF